MKHATFLLCTLVLLSAYIPTLAQPNVDPDKDGPAILGSNAEGTRFIVGFMQNEESDCSGQFSGTQSVAVASRFNTSALIRYPDGRTIRRIIPATTIITFTFNSFQYECIGEGICDQSIEIIADDPVSIYCFSSKTHTSDGYLALPVSSWGTEYLTANYYNDHYNLLGQDGFPDPCNVEPRRGEFAIIAAEDSTVVQVWPQADTRSGGFPGSSIQQVLMEGEMWQIQDAGSIRGGSDITGSRIVASKPVGLLSGHMRTAIPFNLNTKDHLIEMLPPTTTYGKRYIVVPFGGRNGGDVARVVASETGITNVRVINNLSSVNYRINGAGSFQQIPISQNQVTVIETDQPVLTAHYSQSNGVDESSKFDPYMVVVTPEEQFVNTAIFQTMPDGGRWVRYIDTTVWEKQFTQHFVTLVAERDKVDQLMLDNSPILNYPAIVGTGMVPSLEDEYIWLTLRLPGGQAFTIEGEALFGGYVYGIGEFDSYGWPVGAGIRDLKNPDIITPQLSAEPGCGKAWYDVVITDSTNPDWGLKNVWLDETSSSNVEITSTYPCVCGLDKYELQVRLVDPLQPGKARIIAEDNGGNLDTIDLDLSVTPPAFSSNQIEILKAELNKLYTEPLSIANPSLTDALQLDSIRLQRGVEFQIVGLGTGGGINRSLQPSEDFKLDVSFLTDTEGEYSDTLLVYANCQVYKIPLRALMVVPLIDTEDLDFGAIRVGRLKCIELTVTNPGDADLHIDEVRINGKRGTFTFDRNNVPKDTIWLEPGESKVIIVCFEPDAIGDFDGTVEFISNARAGKSVATLVGKGIYPKLQINGYNFGDIQIGDTSCTKVPVVNTGSDTAFLTGLMIADDIFVEDPSVFPYALAPGDTIWVPICFAPSEEKNYLSLLGADNLDGLEATDSLRGSGYQLLAEVDGYNWYKRWVGTQHDTIVHIRNLTSRAIEIDNVWLDGDNGDFAILTQIPPSFTLEPNEEYPLAVRFTPLLRGVRMVSISASTSSRLRPIIENILEGEGIEAIPGDELVHDTSTAYSCDSRTSRVLIYNRGNADLTIENIRFNNPDGTATLNAPNAGYQIPVGDDPLELEILFNFNGYSGVATATVTWGFKELPGESWSRTVTLSSELQEYEISAEAPPRVDIGDEFDLLVEVEKAIWENVPQDEISLEITYNPAVSLFDVQRFNQSMGLSSGDWSFVGKPVFPYPDSGVVQLQIRPTNGVALPLEGVTFPAIPFRGYLGNKDGDSFGVTMNVGSSACILPSSTNLPYSIAHICGLDHRLFVIAGDPPALRPSKPNPASSSISIEFTLPFEGHTRLELFSVDGKRIRRIIDGIVGSGNHLIVLDVGDLPNGVYFYRLDYGSFTASQQLIIRK